MLRVGYVAIGERALLHPVPLTEVKCYEDPTTAIAASVRLSIKEFFACSHQGFRVRSLSLFFCRGSGLEILFISITVLNASVFLGAFCARVTLA